jgi:ligand-binding sensor domain-containing protein
MKALQFVARLVIFGLILALGTTAALVAGESQGLALARLSNTSVQAVAHASQGSGLYVALDGGAQPAGIYRSEDNGLTWRLVSSGPGLALKALAVHPTQPNVVYAGTNGGPAINTASLWRSADGGVTWHRFTVGMPADAYGNVPAVTALAVNPSEPDVLYVGTAGQGVYRFDVQRNSYELVGGISMASAHVRSLVIGPQNRLYAITSQGAFFTDGAAWQPLARLPEQPASLAVAPNDSQTLFIGGTSTGIYRSTDGAATWELAGEGITVLPGASLRVTALAVDAQNGNRVVAATALGVGSRLIGDALYQSENNGASWTKVAELQGIVNQLAVEDGVIYAGGDNGLARYGAPAEPTPSRLVGFDWAGLSNPTGVQVLILVLTIALAGIALIWRRDWLVRRGQSTC